jgi:hypothetical protein
VCRLGRNLYLNIVLGATGDPDTIHYAINRLVTDRRDRDVDAELQRASARPAGPGRNFDLVLARDQARDHRHAGR